MSDHRRIEIAGDIDDAVVHRVRAVSRANPLAALHLQFDTRGGFALSGLALHHVLRAHCGPISAHVTSSARCCSAGLIGFLAADRRTAGRSAEFLWHPVTFAPGPSNHHPGIRQFVIDSVNFRIGRIWENRLGWRLGEFSGEMYMTSRRAAALGVIHRVTDQ
jgi:ATP-dependent protease ClpP protease subunit